jgi:citrate/tricarballylate utilization protein
MQEAESATAGASDGVHASPALAEAARLMTICNSCRYCEGLCAVFPAMEMRRSFADADLRYLANLCHACGACYDDCQFAPPHEFAINVPKTLGEVREESYRTYAWPSIAGSAFEKGGLVAGISSAIALALFVCGLLVAHEPSTLFGVHVGPGAFYRLIPHNTLVAIFGAASLFAAFAMILSFVRFWMDMRGTTGQQGDAPSFWQAMRDALSLRYLEGGGAGCTVDADAVKDRRKLYHHLTFYGFMLCFASTSVATLYHYLFGRIAPYEWYDLPVVLGTVGGIGLLIGPIGLIRSRIRQARRMDFAGSGGLGNAFTVMLFAVSLTGLLLLVFRATPAMGTLFAIHLGCVLGLFITLPYSKFVHGFYRFGALVHYAGERRRDAQGSAKSTTPAS